MSHLEAFRSERGKMNTRLWCARALLDEVLA